MTRKIGIVGGVGWPATVDYYSALHELAARHSLLSGSARPGDCPLEISIESLDLGIALELLECGRRDDCWEPFDAYHRIALDRLERAGAEILLIASNTPHDRLPRITSDRQSEVIDLFACVTATAQEAGARKLLVLGTETTMGSSRLRDLLAAGGIEAVSMPAGRIDELQQLITDLQNGRITGARDRLLEIVRASGISSAEECLVGLHCTELPLALDETRRSVIACVEGFRFINPSIAHVEAALAAAGF
jgi:aspartate racemase